MIATHFRQTLAGLGVVLVLIFATPAGAAPNSFPDKTVRIIVPAAVGGAVDITTRLIAEKMSKNLGQQVIVENRAGADALIGTRYVKTSRPDGYTLLAQANGFMLLPHLRDDTGYNPLGDFTGIGWMIRSPMVMLVRTGEPSSSVKDFIQRAKTNNFSFASGGISAPPHVAASMFLQKQGLKLTSALYRGNGAALPDVVAGRVTMIFDAYQSSAPYIQSHRLKALAVTSGKRITPLQDIPTFKEQGFDYEFTLWIGLLAPTGTPADAIQKLSASLKFAMSDPELKKRFINEGSDLTFITPTGFNEYLKEEGEKMTHLVKQLNLPKQ